MAKKRRKKRNLDPEPGGWVMDKLKNMPVVNPPGDLPEGKIETKYLRDQVVAHEGLGYCIWEIVAPAKIQDPKLRALWVKARAAMLAVQDYMEEA